MVTNVCCGCRESVVCVCVCVCVCVQKIGGPVWGFAGLCGSLRSGRGDATGPYVMCFRDHKKRQIPLFVNNIWPAKNMDRTYYGPK